MIPNVHLTEWLKQKQILDCPGTGKKNYFFLNIENKHEKKLHGNVDLAMLQIFLPEMPPRDRCLKGPNHVFACLSPFTTSVIHLTRLPTIFQSIHFPSPLMQLLASIQQRMKCPPLKSVHVKIYCKLIFIPCGNYWLKKRGKLKLRRRLEHYNSSLNKSQRLKPKPPLWLDKHTPP